MKLIIKNKTLFVLSLFFLSLSACFSPKQPAEDLTFFFFESCPSCDDYIMAQEYSGMIAKLNKSRKWEGKSFNLITPEAAQQLKTTLSEKNLPDISRSLPLLIIGREYINGYEAIGKKLGQLLVDEF